MGGTTSSEIVYGVFIGPEKEGETRVLRHPEIGEGPLHDYNKYGVKTAWEALEYSTKRRPNGNFLGTRRRVNGVLENKYTWKTYSEVKELTVNYAKGIASLNLCPATHTEKEGDFKFLAIYSKNREEWVISDLACGANSMTVVTIYDTLGDKAIEYILSQTEVKTMVTECKNLKKLLELKKQNLLSKVENFILLEDESGSNDEIKKELKEQGMHLYTFNEIIDEGKKSNVALIPSEPETVISVCYTSGTTGYPKGVKITHKSFMSEVDVLNSLGFELEDSDIYISFLPLAHNMERLIFHVLLTRGVAMGFYSGDTRKIVEDAAILKPTCLCGVPRIFQRIYEAIQKKLSQLGGIKKAIVEKAIESKLEQFKNTGVWTDAFWDTLVFGQFREVLGGSIRFMLTGSAPMAPEVLNFLKIAFSCVMVEGYGQTEDNSGMILTKPYDPIAGHLGGAGYANEIKLIDVPELGYTSKDKNPETGILEPRGEICIRGPTVFKGYFKDEEHTKEAIDDEGWLHTGDIGVILTWHGNAIKIIDRKKNIFKLSQGEYVAPEKLENVLVKSEYVEQMCIYGDPYQNYIVAILVPRIDTVIKFLGEHGITATKENVFDYYEREDLKNDILQNLEKLGRANGFKGFEIIRKIYLSKEAFTIENDLITPTLKPKRHNVKKKFIDEINKMYQS